MLNDYPRSDMKTLYVVDICIPALGLICTVALFLAGFSDMAQGCMAGAVIVSLDWWLMRYLYGRLVKKEKEISPQKIGAAIILGFKFIFIVFLLYLVIYKLNFNGYGAAVGIGGLPMGVFIGYFFSTRSEDRAG